MKCAICLLDGQEVHPAFATIFGTTVCEGHSTTFAQAVMTDHSVRQVMRSVAAGEWR